MNENDLSNTLNQEKAYKWKGKVGLVNVSDYVKASANAECLTVAAYSRGSTCFNNSSSHNWLYAYPTNKSSALTIAPIQLSASYYIMLLFRLSYINGSDYYASTSYNVNPVFYLSSNFKFSGTGSSTDPYVVTS